MLKVEPLPVPLPLPVVAPLNAYVNTGSGVPDALMRDE
jgi:hypothetical protein